MRINHIKYVADYWNSAAESYRNSHPEHFDTSMHPSWGLWHVPESQIRILGETEWAGRTILDLGCGRGHDAVAFASLGANVVAIDVSSEQLSNAIPHPQVEYLLSAAEKLPTDTSSIDVVISDHGAFDHSPPDLLLREVSRVLKRGGLLAICTYSPLVHICYDSSSEKVGRELTRPYPDASLKFDGQMTYSHLPYSGWIGAFHAAGFVVERLEELIMPADATNYFNELVDSDWASKWPCDIIWLVRKI